MKIATWNVNSITQRLPRALALLRRHDLDVLCMQETKITDDRFPVAAFEQAGYRCALHGQPGRNGVAIVSRAGIEDPETGFPDDPAPEQARVVSATAGGIRVVSVYTINGKETDQPEYALKLRWLDALVAWLGTQNDRPLLVAGDFNVTPDDRDVHDPDLWRGHNLCSEAERDRIRALAGHRYTDLLRMHRDEAGPHTWWDYRAGAFHKGWGLRIDLAFGTAPVAARCAAVEVDRNERKPTSGEGKPSDHAPVIVSLG